MTLKSAVVASALIVGGLTLATASAAAADEPSPNGTYTFEAEDGEHATWNLVSCPDDPPGCVRVAEFGNSKRAPWSGDAHYTVGSWILLVGQSDAILCADGTTVPGQNTYSWDNATLSGNVSILSNGACGSEAKSLSIPFRLTRNGPAPVAVPPAGAPQPPGQPAAQETPPPPAAPLPAESAAGSS